MKTYILRFHAVDKDSFNRIKNGRKAIETKAGSERYRKIMAGDNLTIVCGKERVTKTIKQAHHFKTIGALLKALPLKKIMPDVTTEAEARKIWLSYPSYVERIKKLGIIAWELK